VGGAGTGNPRKARTPASGGTRVGCEMPRTTTGKKRRERGGRELCFACFFFWSGFKGGGGAQFAIEGLRTVSIFREPLVVYLYF